MLKKKLKRFEIQENRIMETRRAKYACTICGSKFTSFSDLSSHRDTHENDKSDDDDDDPSSHEDDDDSWQDEESFDTQSEESDYELLTLNNKQKTNYNIRLNKEGADDVTLVREASANDLTCNWCLDDFDNDEDLKAHVKLHLTLSTVKAESREKEYHSLDDNSSTKENEDNGQKKKTVALCFYCSKSEQSIDHLSTHFNLTKGEGYFCHFCAYETTEKENISEHIRTVHATECYMCKEKFSTRTDLVSHLKTKHGTPGFKNNGQSSDKSREKEQHQEVEEPCQGSLCFYCPKPTQSVEHLSTHFVVTKGKRFFCHLCFSTHGRKYRFFKHIRIFHSKQCYICRKKFSNREHLLSHLKDQHEGEAIISKEPTFRYCTTCNKIVDEDVAAHKAKEHTQQCSLCLKVFINPDKFRDHMKYVHETELRCDKCGIRLSSRATFKKHMKHHDPLAKKECDRRRERERNAPREKCPTCNKMVSIFRMTEHKKRHTSGRVVCSICGKSVKATDVRTHINQEHKPCTCPICNKEYIGHRRRDVCRENHIRKFKCDVCSKDYSRKAGLVVHQRLHTGEKPFPCTECDRKFYTRQILYKHMLSHGIDTRANKKRVPSLILSSEGPNGL